MRLAALPGSAPLVSCAKGIERGTHAFMTEVLGQAAPGRRTAILSGPSFAADVAAGLPTAVTLASTDEGLARALCDALRGPSLRLYHSTDVRGVEIGGAAKNVLAIACGVAVGRGLGASAAAALIARGFAELRRFGEAFGARGSTLMGLSGLGDLVLTCSSAQSRNFAFGQALGRGVSVAEAGAGKLAEGVFTARGADRVGARAWRRHADRQLRRGVDRRLARRRGCGRRAARTTAERGRMRRSALQLDAASLKASISEGRLREMLFIAACAKTAQPGCAQGELPGALSF